MDYPEVRDVKRQLRIDADNVEFDDEIHLKLQSATVYAERYCGFSFRDEFGDDLPAPLKDAVILLAALFFSPMIDGGGISYNTAHNLMNSYKRAP